MVLSPPHGRTCTKRPFSVRFYSSYLPFLLARPLIVTMLLRCTVTIFVHLSSTCVAETLTVSTCVRACTGLEEEYTMATGEQDGLAGALGRDIDYLFEKLQEKVRVLVWESWKPVTMTFWFMDWNPNPNVASKMFATSRCMCKLFTTF